MNDQPEPRKAFQTKWWLLPLLVPLVVVLIPVVAIAKVFFKPRPTTPHEFANTIRRVIKCGEKIIADEQLSDEEWALLDEFECVPMGDPHLESLRLKAVGSIFPEPDSFPQPDLPRLRGVLNEVRQLSSEN